MLSEYTLAQRLKDLRNAMAMTQAEVAEAIGTTASTLANWEQGAYRPNVDTLRALCRLYGCSADYLLGLPGEELTDEEALRLDRLRRLDDDGLLAVDAVIESQLIRLGR